MNIAITILLICLIIIFFQDWKYRSIHVVLPIILFIIAIFIIAKKTKILFELIAYNSAFIILILTILIVYMSIKNKQFLNPFQNYFGLGDLFLYIAITPLFLLKNYVVFFILSMLFAIILQIGLKKIMKQNSVPLAGFSALLLLILIIKDIMLNFQKITLL